MADRPSWRDSRMQSTYNGIPDGVSIGSQLPAQSNGCAARWPGNPVNLTAGFKRARPRAHVAFKVNPFANLRGRPPRNCPCRFVQLVRGDCYERHSNWETSFYEFCLREWFAHSGKQTWERNFTTHPSAVLCARKDLGSDKDRWWGSRTTLLVSESSPRVGALPGLDIVPSFGGSINVLNEPITASSIGVDAPELFAFRGLFVTVRSDVVIQMSLLEDDEVFVDEETIGPLGNLLTTFIPWMGDTLLSLLSAPSKEPGNSGFRYTRWCIWSLFSAPEPALFIENANIDVT